MRMIAMTLAAAVLGIGLAGCECDMNKKHDDGMGDGMKGKHAMMDHDAMMAKQAVAVIYPTKGNSVSGTVTFTQEGDNVHIHGTISGLEPNSTHALHIHEFGDQTSDNGMSTGGHYNPTHHEHGAPDAANHHAGDFGNVKADGSGNATVDLTVNDISIGGGNKPGILGRGLVIHAKADDMHTQPSGAAGDRIGVGVIGVAKGPQ